MQVWADVYDANRNKLGEGPVDTLTYAQVSRNLDKIGQVQLRAAGGDYRAVSLLTNERRLKVWYDDNREKRLLGEGIIRQPRFSEDSGTVDLAIDANDILDELTRINCLLGREYDTQPIDTVIADLVGLVSGWSSSTDETDTIDALIDGASVWKALLAIAEANDLHLRLGEDSRTVEIGEFGDHSGVRIVQAFTAANAAAEVENVALLMSPEITFDSSKIVNRIYPLGGGQGTAKLTLELCTLSGQPYEIKSVVGPNGETLYYIEDAASIAEFGVIEKFMTTDISPFANTKAATRRAADLLYKTARRYLRQAARLQRVYRMTVKGLTQKVKPGQLVYVDYEGFAYQHGRQLKWLNVDADLWVLSVTETVTADGLITTLELSNIDRVVRTDEDMVLATMEQVQVEKVTVKPYPFWSENTLLDAIQADQSGGGGGGFFKQAVFKIEIDGSVLNLDEVKIRFKTRPLFTQAFVPTAFNTYYYAVFVSDNYPSNISLFINGEDVTSEFGGPWASVDVNAAVDVEIDITDKLLEASGGFQQEHDIVFEADTLGSVRNVQVENHSLAAGVFASHGWVELNVRVAGVRQAY